MLVHSNSCRVFDCPIFVTEFHCPSLIITKKGALDLQLQVIKFTSCLPMIGDSLRVLRLLPPLKLVAMIYM
jgi:hypothetical protein